ncbi:MAG: polyphosphate polymerase domain-containing protein [Verrucomicrobia bacterium]|nr:polyphosphate polymerase domain-containing protein [Verrucomicrobiota bacterium]
MSPSTDSRENREFASELKFLVPPALCEPIRDWARARLSPDPHVSADLGDAYRITSLYFDTEQFDVFYRKGSYGRSKYRIRRYGPSEFAFLERKLKTRGLVSKRRSLVKIDQLPLLADGAPDREWSGFWYHQRLIARRLKPICEIAYRRTARVTMTSSGPIRLTMDEDIRSVAASHVAFNGAHEGGLLSKDHVILELKFRLEMPGVFKELLEAFQLKPQPVSKYRLAAVALGLVVEQEPKEAKAAPV